MEASQGMATGATTWAVSEMPAASAIPKTSFLADKKRVCMFTGHRNIPEDKILHMVNRLDEEIERLVGLGFTVFQVGGALGADYITSLVIINKRLIHKDIKLVLALPYRDFDSKWPSDKHRILYRELFLPQADEIIYVSEEYDRDCYRRRNQFMADNSAYCLCAMLRGQEWYINDRGHGEKGWACGGECYKVMDFMHVS